MNTATPQYKQKVWAMLEALRPGEVREVELMAKKESRDVFVAAIKEYMDSEPWQGNITFNHDYSKFYKMHPVTEKIKTKQI